MSNIKRSKVVMLVATMSALNLVACGVSDTGKATRALSMLTEKYQEDFNIVEVYPQKIGEPYYDVRVYPVDDPEICFSATIDTEDENISDTYVERRVCSEISKMARRNLGALSEQCYLFVHAIGPQPIVDDIDITVEDYAALDSYNRFQIELFVMSGKTDADTIYNELSSLYDGMSYLKGGVCLYVVDADHMEAVQEYFAVNDSLYLEFYNLADELSTFDIPYANGSIMMDRGTFTSITNGVL